MSEGQPDHHQSQKFLFMCLVLLSSGTRKGSECQSLGGPIRTKHLGVPELNPLSWESRFGALKAVNRRFEAIRANPSSPMKVGAFLRIDSRESPRFALRIAEPSKCQSSNGHSQREFWTIWGHHCVTIQENVGFGGKKSQKAFRCCPCFRPLHESDYVHVITLVDLQSSYETNSMSIALHKFMSNYFQVAGHNTWTPCLDPQFKPLKPLLPKLKPPF